MPVKRCNLNGKPGWKWGDSGICYTGTEAKQKAERQGIAVLTSEAVKSGAKTKEEISEYISTHSEKI